MTEFAAALEATAVAEFLKRSRWVYPLVNAGHVLGLALLVGAIVPMDVSVLRGRRSALWLRTWAAAGFALAAACGTLLFVTQAGDYLRNPWFLGKIGVIAVALGNAVIHLRFERLTPVARWRAALVSLALWPAALILGRMVGYA